jgi:hypothetical protein
MEYGRFQIEVYERKPGKWRASPLGRFKDPRRLTRLDVFTTSADTSTADQASALVRKEIDAGTVQ